MNPFRSFPGRLTVGFLGTLFLLSLVAVLVLLPRLRASARLLVDEQLHSAVVLLAPAAREQFSTSESDLQALLAEVGLASGLRLSAIAPDGRVIADSDLDPAAMENHADRPELRAALADGQGSSERFSQSKQLDMRYVAVAFPAPPASASLLLRASRPVSEIESRLANIGRLFALLAILSALLASAAALLLTRRLSAPLRELTTAAHSMADGNLDARVTPRGHDEIGLLAASFNRMGDRLRDQIATIDRDRAANRAILATMEEGVVAVDAQRRLLHCNRAARELFGVEGKWRHRPLAEFIRHAEIDEAVSLALAGEGELRRELTMAGQFGDRILELQGKPLGDGGALIVLHDISQLRGMQQQRRDFVTNVSHELKTPLAAVRGLVESIVDHEDMPNEVRGRFLARALDQVHRMTHLVSELMILSRAERPGLPLERARVDLRAIFQDSVEGQMAAAASQNILLEVALPAQPCRILGDEEGLRQIFDNLLSNALHYSAPGAEVRASLRQEAGQAIAEITDQGIGIPKEQQERIFERFYRVDKGRSREQGGTGLGLSIVKHQLNRLEGRIELESQPGVGSRFRVYFPLASPE